MSKSIPALVKPALLVWARDRAGLSLEMAAESLGLSTERLELWERGEDRPTIAQLRKLGELYKRPIAVFFLPEPPAGFDPQREFRRLPGLRPQNESPELRMALRTALYRREAAKELYASLGETPRSLTEALQPTESEGDVVRRVRPLLGISWEAQIAWPSAYTAFNNLRGAIERLGVLVFQASGIELSEMRGISVPQGPLPVILINIADAPHGRIFSLMHEFVHILLTNGGHETSRLEGQRAPEEQYLERVSNRFAAAVLMPAKEFLMEAQRFPEAIHGDEKALKRFAEKIKVSPEAILRRLVSLGRATGGVYRNRRKAWRENSVWYVPTPSGGGPPHHVKVVAARGRGFVSLVLDGYHRNVISSSTVTDLLGVQLKFLDRVERELAGGPGEKAVT